jgi:hypothetical protein
LQRSTKIDHLSTTDSDPMPALTLVHLNATPAAERDWLALLLSRFEITHITSTDFSAIVPGALYVTFDDKRLELPKTFLEAVREAGGCGLIHLGDEYFRGDFTIYSYFDYIIRNDVALFLEGEGLMHIPLGYTNGLTPLESRPASQRAWLWSFAGGRRPERTAMAHELARARPAYLNMPMPGTSQKFDPRPQYLATLADTMFIPCGEGNILLETPRPYEALEFGAIPLLPKRAKVDIYGHLFGASPIPTFDTWREAADFLIGINKDAERLDALQADVLAWWAAAKESWTNRMTRFIETGRTGVWRKALKDRFSTWSGFEKKMERAGALWDQQNAVQIKGRLSRIPERVGAMLKGRKMAGAWAFSGVAPVKPPEGPKA